jgi:RimJ/RimL family protein N-acetyltransferase
MVRDRGRRATTPLDAETPAFHVRPSRPRDARSFLELYRGITAEGRHIRTESVRRGVGHYRRQLARAWGHDQASIVAVAGRRVIGHLSISREEHPVNRHVGSIGMMVAPDWRRRGVGSALMAEALRWAREMRVEKVALTVYPDNEAARALYRRFGFAEEGRLTGHSRKQIGYRDEIVMGLWLTPQPPGGPP